MQFDAATHTYSVDGKRVPSVTQIVAPLYDFSMVADELMRLAQERGSAVHLATELHDCDDLDEESLDPQLIPYLNAYKRFRAETGFVPELIEHQIHDSISSYAGTIDRFGTLNKTSVLIDIKACSSLHKAVGVQLAAYQSGLAKDGIKALARYALQLRKDGTYRLQRYADPNDLPTFHALLTVQRFKEKN